VSLEYAITGTPSYIKNMAVPHRVYKNSFLKRRPIFDILIIIYKWNAQKMRNEGIGWGRGAEIEKKVE